MKRRHLFIGCIIILSMIILSNVNAQSSKDKASAKAFVKQFYDWYVVLSMTTIDKKNPMRSDFDAINKKADLFDLKLRNALIEDMKAQLKADEIVGLDFDPFIGSQEHVFGCEVGNVKQVDNKFFVDIQRDLASKSKKAILTGQIAVIAEVIKTNTGWKFTNFIYPRAKANLMQTLIDLRKEREKWGKK